MQNANFHTNSNQPYSLKTDRQSAGYGFIQTGRGGVKLTV